MHTVAPLQMGPITCSAAQNARSPRARRGKNIFEVPTLDFTALRTGGSHGCTPKILKNPYNLVHTLAPLKWVPSRAQRRKTLVLRALDTGKIFLKSPLSILQLCGPGGSHGCTI